MSCPCAGGRSAEQAAQLVDRVLPLVPTRQWVLFLPFALRFRLARDHRLLTAVSGVVPRAILGFQRRRAQRDLSVAGGRCGAVTVVQGFGGGSNLNVPVNCVVLDGVHEEAADGSARFHALPGPSGLERLVLAERIGRRVRRVRRLLERRGLLDDEAPLRRWRELDKDTERRGDSAGLSTAPGAGAGARAGATGLPRRRRRARARRTAAVT